MLSQIPIDFNKDAKDVDKQVCRVGIIAELDAISLYEQLAAETKSSRIRNMLLDIAKEEKTHAGEFQALLLEIDKQQEKELVQGRKEVKEKA